jgi:hypothetical protein
VLKTDHARDLVGFSSRQPTAKASFNRRIVCFMCC